MPISYKHKIYTTLGTPTDLSGDVVSATDSVGVPAKDYTVKGKTIVWNQLWDKSKYPATKTINGVTFTNNGDGTIIANGTATANAIFSPIGVSNSISIVSGHKFLFTSCPSGGSLTTYYSDLKKVPEDETFFDVGTGVIMTAASTVIGLRFNIRVVSGYTANNLVFKPQLFDLTKMFGAGNEPATPEEFRAMFPEDYYSYNAGEIKTIVPTSVEASTVNLLDLVGRKEITSNDVGYRTPTDAYPEIDTHIYYNGVAPNGYLASWYVVTGATVLSSSSVIAKTGTDAGSHAYGVGIPLTVVPSTTYYIKCTTSGVVGIGYLNSNKIITQFKGALSGPNITITTPGDCRYILIVFKPNALDTLATFENICVSAVQTNEYQPYSKYRVNIPSSKYFPDGMRSAGSAYDEINFLSQKAIKRIGVVDMGTLDWGSNPGTYPTNSFYSIDFHDAKRDTRNIISNGKFNNIYANNGGMIIAITDSDEKYDSSEAFKAAMSGVMLYYELATPVETAITPPLQALSTFKGFNSFSAPNSLMQNGPLSVTYYAEGGANPEKGWLTSYKRKLYMGRNIEWNQLLDKSKFRATVTSGGITVRNNGDGTFTINGTKEEGGGTTWIWFYNNRTENVSLAKKLYGHKILYGCVQNPSSGSTNNTWGIDYEINNNMTNGAYTRSNLGESAVIATLNKVAASDITKAEFYFYFRPSSSGTAVYKDVVMCPQLFDLTQMFGAGNEPSTPEEFWSYFDHKPYPYNAGETQPLFKISRKSLWTVAPKHYTARWDKVHAAMVRLNDAASFPTNITNFAHRGSVNANYSNPFDNIYPWSGIKLCNISIDLYRNLSAGDSITKCVTAWEGDANFSYNDVNGVWRYRPEFWGKSWEDDTYRYFDVADNKVYDSSYVYYPEAIVGRWHGRAATLTVGGAQKTCLVPSVGMPAKRIAVSTLHTYAKNYGATIDSIFSIDADVLLCIVEFATMNTQNAIGNGATSMERQSSDRIAEAATNSNVVRVLASAASGVCIPGAIFDIGTSDGGVQVGSYYVVSVQLNGAYLNVTLNKTVTVTTSNYWSVHGIINVADEEIGSKSGYVGTNGKCNSYYRGIVLFGNMFSYTLGAYENYKDRHIWIANGDEEADNYDALNTSVHYDTGLVLPSSSGYTKNLGMLPRSGLLSIPVFCTEIGGGSNNPTGDYFYNGVYTYNTVLCRGGRANGGPQAGALYGAWDTGASVSNYGYAARPRLKNP